MSYFAEVSQHPSYRATYWSAPVQTTPAASTTDIWSIYGSSSMIIRILYIGVVILGTYTSGTYGMPIYLYKRSTANTGGTHTAPASIALDSTDSAASASLAAYTANPSGLGTSVGLLRGFNIDPNYINESFAQFGADVPIWTTNVLGKALQLNSATEGVCVNFGGTVPIESTTVGVGCLWTESTT